MNITSHVLCSLFWCWPAATFTFRYCLRRCLSRLWTWSLMLCGRYLNPTRQTFWSFACHGSNCQILSNMYFSLADFYFVWICLSSFIVFALFVYVSSSCPCLSLSLPSYHSPAISSYDDILAQWSAYTSVVYSLWSGGSFPIGRAALDSACRVSVK